MLSYIKERSTMTVVQIANVKNQLQMISSLISTLSTTQNNVEIVGSLVENELLSMDKAIEEAVTRIQVLDLLSHEKVLEKVKIVKVTIATSFLSTGYVG